MSSTKRDRFYQLVIERKDKAAELATMKSARSAAKISGASFDSSSEIAALEGEIVALDEAVVEVDRQAQIDEDREEAAKRAEEVDCKLQEIDRCVDNYANAVGAAQASAKELVRFLLYVNSCAERLRGIVPKSEGQGDWGSIDSQNVRTRISERMARAMMPLGHGVYGQFRWAPEGSRPEDWAAEERQRVENEIALSRRMLTGQRQELQTRAEA